MKIIQIVAAYKPAYIYGGPTMSVAKLCETLVKNKGQELNHKDEFKLEVFTTTANGKKELNVKPNEDVLVDGVKVTYFKRLTKDHTHFSPTLLLALRREILRNSKNNKNLIIHLHAWWNLVSILSCAIAKWYKIPVLLTPRGMLTAYTNTNRNSIAKQLIHKFLGKNLLRYCHIHVTSEKEKRDVLAITTPKSITVIPNLVELGNEQISVKSANLSPSEHPHFKLIFLSRIEQKKGLELLFDALSMNEFKWKLTIGGSGEKGYVESLKLKIENLKIQDNIYWIGQVKNEDKFAVLAEHDLMVLTSYNENFANVVIESLSVGTPVLLSNEVGLSDYVEENKLGWITDMNPTTIANTINEAFKLLDSRVVIRKTAPAIIIQDFKSEHLIKRYFTLYANIK